MDKSYLSYVRDDLITRLESLIQKLDRENYDNLSIEVTKNTIFNIVYDIKRYFFETLFTSEAEAIQYMKQPEVSVHYGKVICTLISSSLDTAKNANTFKDIFEATKQLLEIMNDIMRPNTSRPSTPIVRDSISSEISYRFAVDRWLPHIDYENIVPCFSAKPSNIPYRFFDTSTPYQFDYNTQEYIVDNPRSVQSKNWNIPFDFYGCNTTEYLLPVKYKKVVRGKLDTVKVSPKSIDCLHAFLPMTTYVNTYNGINVNGHTNYANYKEIFMLRFWSNMIKLGGVIMLHLPVYALSNDFCYELAKRYTNFSVFHDTNSLYSRSIITLVGVKRSNNETSGEDVKNCYVQLRNIMVDTYYDNENKRFVIPTFKQDYVLSPVSDFSKKFVFKGDMISARQLKEFFTKTTTHKNLYESEETYFDRYEGKHPLLPFTNGQLGLVLVSGFLDGIIQEDDEHCHIVKGRSSKHITNDIDFGDDKVVTHTNYSNKIEINMFEPDGTYRSLV